MIRRIAAVASTAVLATISSQASAATMVFELSFYVTGSTCGAVLCDIQPASPLAATRISFTGVFDSASVVRGGQIKRYDTAETPFTVYDFAINGYQSNSVGRVGRVSEILQDGIDASSITFKLTQDMASLPSPNVSFTFSLPKNYPKEFGSSLLGADIGTTKLGESGAFDGLYAARSCAIGDRSCLLQIERLSGVVTSYQPTSGDPLRDSLTPRVFPTYRYYQAPPGFSLPGQAGVVPEPATWAMMLIGFGGIGVTMRLHRRGSRERRIIARSPSP